MDDLTERMLESHADIEKHGPYQVAVTCGCGRTVTTIITKGDYDKSSAPVEGRTKLLTRKTCPKCASDEFGDDED
ncbi:hypothetical protein LCGC14_2556600 [marine sediment metagenome]|uniref:Uncharacterized protein n=1 Tax=marine sediment metagenome TaxID=412755 RepID=A0A0F9ALV2_9ZZZZ